MNAAETIRAAIDNLETLKAKSSHGPWELRGGNEWIAPLGLPVGSEDEATWVISQRDADLIVTLHRTIDAQLAILENALIDHFGCGRPILADTLDLARAILGGDS